MRPTEILMQEHRVIEQVLDCLETMAQRAEAGEGVDLESAKQAIDFFRNFADRCHHGKEEDCLFPLLEQKGFCGSKGRPASCSTNTKRDAGMSAAWIKPRTLSPLETPPRRPTSSSMPAHLRNFSESIFSKKITACFK